MKKLGCMFLACIGIMAMIVTGCATGPTRLEADYGNSLHFARFQQTLDLAAGQNLALVVGFDAKAAEATIDRYRTTFEKPPPPPAFAISIGQIR